MFVLLDRIDSIWQGSNILRKVNTVAMVKVKHTHVCNKKIIIGLVGLNFFYKVLMKRNINVN